MDIRKSLARACFKDVIDVFADFENLNTNGGSHFENYKHCARTNSEPNKWPINTMQLY